MSSPKNKIVVCLECARCYTRQNASKRRKNCGFLKCPNCNFNFHTSSSKEKNIHIKKKRSSCHNSAIQGDRKHFEQLPNKIDTDDDQVIFLKVFIKVCGVN